MKEIKIRSWKIKWICERRKSKTYRWLFYLNIQSWQGCLLTPCLFNLNAEYIMRNAGLDELQVEINIGRRNSDLRYVDDTTLMAQNEDELNSLLMRVKEENESLGLKVKA